jgi:adenine-specific DNA-methyltransferase
VARIDDLLRRIPDAQLRADLTAAIAEVRRTRNFGLVYESHLPETCRLYSHPIRRGVKAAMRSADDGALYLVASVDGPMAKLVLLRDADGLAVPAGDHVPTEMPIEDIVVVAEFGDPIHPGLKRVGSLDRGGDKPAHVVINGENHHALEALRFTHAGKIDCIYIDPPYNSGARDWKYNNDYVDANDTYRHSKWLAMTERRLTIARELLNPEDSVLIVTIDEKEVHRLGLQLHQLFPECRAQLVTTVINRKGNARRGEFSRCEEYLYILRLGDAALSGWHHDMLHPSNEIGPQTKIRWKSLLRLASTGRSSGRFNLFYPLFFDAETGRFLRAGAPLGSSDSIEDVEVPSGETVLWPISRDGADGRWSIGVDKFNDYMGKGYIKFGGRIAGGRTPYYLMASQIAAIESGDLLEVGRDDDGAVILEVVAPRKQPMSVWNVPSHSTSGAGTSLLRSLLPDRRFPYPKSLYAVEDALRFFVKEKADAVVLDFFAGSGTTAHAVMRLNRQDGGRRQSILVTNNEVSVDEAMALTKQGHREGDAAWEALGIFKYITRPRIEAVITGRTPDGDPVKGDYKFVDEFPMAEGFEENVEFLELTYQDAAAVELDLVFEAVAPLLWMRAGGQGAMVGHHDEAGFAWAERYGVLWDTDRWQPFAAAAPESAVMAFIVTDSVTAFAAVAAELPAGVGPVRLYENYLATFAINQTEQA